MSITTAIALVVSILGLSISGMITAVVFFIIRGRVDMKRIEMAPGTNRDNGIANHQMFDR